METYVKNGMVPRSLRWEVSPQLEDWFSCFNTAGINPLKFLIEPKNTKLARLDEEIKVIKDKLNPLKESSEYKERSLSLLKILEKEDRDQKNKKKKKYNRDLLDYQGAIVFEWQKRLLAEQAPTTTSDTGVGVPASMGPPPPGSQSVSLRPPLGGHSGPPMRNRQGPYQSPYRRGGGGRGGTSSSHPPPLL